MVGRAAVGQPWIVGEIAAGLRGEPRREPSSAERRDAALEHLHSLLATMGARTGLRHARKHLSAYAERAGAAESLRLRLVTTESADEAITLLAGVFTPGFHDLAAAEAA